MNMKHPGNYSKSLRSSPKLNEKLTKVQKDLYDRKIGSLLKYLQAKDQLLNAEKAQFNAQSAITKAEI